MITLTVHQMNRNPETNMSRTSPKGTFAPGINLPKVPELMSFNFPHDEDRPVHPP